MPKTASPSKSRKPNPHAGSGSRPRLDRERGGYYLGPRFRKGFADDPELPEGARRRIAGWARALTPNELSDTQRELLVPRTGGVSAAQRKAERLGSYEASPWWKHLTDAEKAKVEAAEYPLGIGGLAKLVRMSEPRLRYWEERGLLPARRTSGGHRQFFAMAAIRAFVLKRLQQAELTVLRNVYEQRAGNLLAGMAMIMHEHTAATKADSTRELFEQTADHLEKVSLAMVKTR